MPEIALNPGFPSSFSLLAVRKSEEQSKISGKTSVTIHQSLLLCPSITAMCSAVFPMRGIIDTQITFM